jgi:hypothetical protein
MEMMHGGPDLFDATYVFDSTHHQGANNIYVTQIKDGRWVALTKSLHIDE